MNQHRKCQNGKHLAVLWPSEQFSDGLDSDSTLLLKFCFSNIRPPNQAAS
ncbi:hypothetical protein [Neisseria sp.]